MEPLNLLRNVHATANDITGHPVCPAAGLQRLAVARHQYLSEEGRQMTDLEHCHLKITILVATEIESIERAIATYQRALAKELDGGIRESYLETLRLLEEDKRILSLWKP